MVKNLRKRIVCKLKQKLHPFGAFNCVQIGGYKMFRRKFVFALCSFAAMSAAAITLNPTGALAQNVCAKLKSAFSWAPMYEADCNPEFNTNCLQWPDDKITHADGEFGAQSIGDIYWYLHNGRKYGWVHSGYLDRVEPCQDDLRRFRRRR
jgi:hypothetical protein